MCSILALNRLPRQGDSDAVVLRRREEVEQRQRRVQEGPARPRDAHRRSGRR